MWNHLFLQPAGLITDIPEHSMAETRLPFPVAISLGTGDTSLHFTLG